MVNSLARRDRRPEVMDQPGLDERLHHQALEGLRRGNVVSNTARVLWRRPRSGGRARRLAAGARAGPRLRRRRRRPRSRAARAASRRRLEAHGCDLSPLAVDHAQAAAERCGIASATFFQLNALEDPLPTDYDAIYLHAVSAPSRGGGRSETSRADGRGDAPSRAGRRSGTLAAGIRTRLGRDAIC